MEACFHHWMKIKYCDFLFHNSDFFFSQFLLFSELCDKITITSYKVRNVKCKLIIVLQSQKCIIEIHNSEKYKLTIARKMSELPDLNS